MAAVLRRAKRRLTQSASSERGFGLRNALQLADTLEVIDKNDGLKAVIYRARVRLSARRFNDLVIVSLTSIDGFANPSFERRLIETVREHVDCSVIVDLTTRTWELDPSLIRGRMERRTPVRTALMRARIAVEIPRLGRVTRAASKRDKRLIILANNPRELLLPIDIVASSWADALRRTGHSALARRLSSWRANRALPQPAPRRSSLDRFGRS